MLLSVGWPWAIVAFVGLNGIIIIFHPTQRNFGSRNHLAVLNCARWWKAYKTVERFGRTARVSGFTQGKYSPSSPSSKKTRLPPVRQGLMFVVSNSLRTTKTIPTSSAVRFFTNALG